MRLGFLGPQGTFSEQAAILYKQSGEIDFELEQFTSIYDVIKAVYDGGIDEGIVPFENSIEGTVMSTIDTLIFDVDLFIKAEVVIHISQQLMTRQGVRFQDIERILSHPQGIAQCRHFLRREFPNAKFQTVESTAGAARMVSESNENIAAIAPKRSAQVYNLEIIKEDIQDDIHNATRFVVITKIKEGCQSTKENPREKTSIAFSIENRPGGLYSILDILNIWDLNMIKIESRPSKSQLGSYVFFVDIETEKEKESDLADALKMLERKASSYKFIGTYPVFE